MGFLDKWLGKEYDASKYRAFGRFSDSLKSAEKYNQWDAALKAYEEERHVDNFKHVLEFLKDEQVENLSYEESRGVISFMFYQGSKSIYGTADRIKLRAEAKIVRVSDLQLGFVKALIDQNFGLQYCRFAIDDDGDICIVFDTYAVDASPYKLYHAFKELAAKADKHDDMLLSQYDCLGKIHSQHISSVPQSEKDLKYAYIKSEIEHILQAVDSGALDTQKLPAAICYLTLDLAYRIDYLVKPEGSTMELVEEIHRTYLQSKETDILLKNQKIIASLRAWLQRPRVSFDEEIYRVISTFGITMPSGHDKLVECLENELSAMDWYYDNQYDHIAKAIPSYLTGYLLFSYALPEPDRAMLHLLYEVLEPSYFEKWGDSHALRKKSKIKSSAIKSAISKIKDTFEEEYPEFDPDVQMLDYKDDSSFAKSYLQMVKLCNLSRVDLRD